MNQSDAQPLFPEKRFHSGASESSQSPPPAPPAPPPSVFPPPPPPPNWNVPEPEQPDALDGEVAIPIWKNALDLMHDATLVTPKFVIADLLHRGMVLMLTGASKSGKTFLLLAMAIAVAAGINFLRWVAYPGRVLFVNCEIPEPFLKQRLRQLCRALQVDETKMSNLDVLTLRGRVVDMEDLAIHLVGRIKPGDYDLIVIDPIYKLYGNRDENSASAIGNLCGLLGKLATHTMAAVVYATHFAKGNQSGRNSIDRASGSGVFGRDADSILALTQHRVEKCYAIETTLRNCPPSKSFVIEWNFPVATIRDDLSPDDLHLPSRARGSSNSKGTSLSLDQFMGLFPDNTTANPEAGLFSAVQLRDEYKRRGWSRTDADSRCQEALEKQLITKAVVSHNRQLHGRPAVVDAYLKLKGKAP